MFSLIEPTEWSPMCLGPHCGGLRSISEASALYLSSVTWPYQSEAPHLSPLQFGFLIASPCASVPGLGPLETGSECKRSSNRNNLSHNCCLLPLICNSSRHWAPLVHIYFMHPSYPSSKQSFHSHSVDKETDSQRSKVTCPSVSKHLYSLHCLQVSGGKKDISPTWRACLPRRWAPLQWSFCIVCWGKVGCVKILLIVMFLKLIFNVWGTHLET